AISGAGVSRVTCRASRRCLQSVSPAFALPPLRSPDPRLGKYSADQLAGAAWQVFGVQGVDQQALPAGRAGVWVALGLRRLAFRFFLAGWRDAAADLGFAGDEHDRRRSSVAAGFAGAAAALAGLDR